MVRKRTRINMDVEMKEYPGSKMPEVPRDDDGDTDIMISIHEDKLKNLCRQLEERDYEENEELAIEDPEGDEEMHGATDALNLDLDNRSGRVRERDSKRQEAIRKRKETAFKKKVLRTLGYTVVKKAGKVSTKVLNDLKIEMVGKKKPMPQLFYDGKQITKGVEGKRKFTAKNNEIPLITELKNKLEIAKGEYEKNTNEGKAEVAAGLSKETSFTEGSAKIVVETPKPNTIKNVEPETPEPESTPSILKEELSRFFNRFSCGNP